MLKASNYNKDYQNVNLCLVWPEYTDEIASLNFSAEDCKLLNVK